MKADILRRLVDARAAKRPAALVTDLGTGMQSIVLDDGVHGAFGMTDEELALVRRHLALDRSAIVEQDERSWFVHAFNPPLRLAIVGAVHIAQALAPVAALSGYDVVIVDPRRAFATETRFPGVALSDDWPDDGLRAIGIDRRTAVVTLTHDPKLDDPALQVALRSPAFYVGSLGSRRTHAKRVARLREAGFSEAEIARIRAPVGLDIGAVSPAEIAVAIMAEITATLRASTGDGAEDG
ncbi:XdhC family protein [Arenibaculum sp.]|jgi:xanthine dehydrogenase accessory factor|uniref:XdhC family protein n=1 Tax=Arenibaculum sp. TaxID=2865862 RepID=UPI002E0D79C0|nr:XdhC family protein [Arenibaculum sp.]